MKFSIVQGLNAGRAKVISCTSLENVYPEIEIAERSKNIKALIGTPGYTDVGESFTSGSNRGVYVTSTDRMFVIVSNKLVEMSTSEVFTTRGTIGTSSGQCNMTDNGTQLFITDGTNGYILTLATNVLAEITDGDFPSNPTKCLFTEGYFLVMEGESGRVWFSASYDGTSWDALDFFTAEYSQDNLQGIIKTSNGTLFLIGKQSTELWQSTGNADLPWQRVSGSVKEIGCIAPDSIASNGSQVAWLGNGVLGYGSVYVGSGYDVQKVSTPAIEYIITNLTSDISDAVAFMYSDETHNFYVVSFGSEKTLVFDLATNEWHIRGTLNVETGLNARQFAQGYGFFNGKHYVGHYQNANIFSMSLDVYDEDGNDIKRVIVTNHINNENKLLRHKRFEIDMEKGVGNVGESDPQIVLQISSDGGHSFSSEAWASASKTPGSVGEYTVRTKWQRLGQARDRVYKLTSSSDTKFIIAGCWIEAY